jgi:hypothetical protein
LPEMMREMVRHDVASQYGRMLLTHNVDAAQVCSTGAKGRADLEASAPSTRLLWTGSHPLILVTFLENVPSSRHDCLVTLRSFPIR